MSFPRRLVNIYLGPKFHTFFFFIFPPPPAKKEKKEKKYGLGARATVIAVFSSERVSSIELS